MPMDTHRRYTAGLSRIEILLFDDEMHSIQNENYRKTGVISTEKGYDTAWTRIYVLGTCTRADAFKLMLTEESIKTFGELDIASKWNAFESAMKYRNGKARR